MLNSKAIITQLNPKSPIAEAYRMLRTNILYSNSEIPLKAFAVTSFGSNEGKTTTIVNLGVTFSQQGIKVLLIDGDLRKPAIHQIFGVEVTRGLADYLLEQKNYTDYVKASQFDHLDVLICGAIPPNPSELLTSNAMKLLIQKAKDDYDIVLIDTPPVGMVTDAVIISKIVDGTILVAASGKISFDALVTAKELLSNVNANIIGVVLNKLDKSNYALDYTDFYKNKRALMK